MVARPYHRGPENKVAEDRTHPPSPRRLGLARRAGLHAASPILVGAAACGGALLALFTLGRSASDALGAAIAAACRGAGFDYRPTSAKDVASAAPGANDAVRTSSAGDTTAALGGAASIDDVVHSVLAFAMPVIAAAALAAVIAHLAQTRMLYMPRRRIDGAPVPEPVRARRAGFELVSAAVIGGVAVGWLWLVAPRLAALPLAPLTGAALVASALAAHAIAWVAIGVLDALVRHAELAHALRMTPREQREDARLAGADPRWRRLRARNSPGAQTAGERAGRPRALSDGDPRDAVAAATLLVLGDDAAVAIAWDPLRRPIPMRTATGRRARATQLLGLARRFRVAVHRDAGLADALLTGEGPVPEAHWARLAEIVAALHQTR